MHTSIEIAFHIGAPYTDHDQLTWSLRKDTKLLTENGVLLRRPKQYRRLLRDRLADVKRRPTTFESQQKLLASIIKNQQVKRLILSNGNFLGAPSWMLNGGKFYQNAGANTSTLRGLFAANPCRFFLGIRNPASLISSAFDGQNSRSFAEFRSNIPYEDIRWSDVVESVRRANPGCPITVWCHEDTPLIWSTVLQRITAFDQEFKFAGELDIIMKIISFDGSLRLRKYLETRPNLNRAQREQVCAIFLEKFVLEHEVEEAIDLPGWSHALVHTMTSIYEDDIQKIMHMSNVDFIASMELPAKQSD